MKSTSDLFNEIIPLGRLIHMVNQKKDRLLNEYLSPLDITAYWSSGIYAAEHQSNF